MATAHRRNVQQRVAQARPSRANRPVGHAQGVGGVGKVNNSNAVPMGRPATPSTPSTPPPAPNPAAGAPAPWDTDPLYVSGVGQANQRRNNDKSDLNAGWQAREQYYGFGQNANPYSQAASLSRQHDIRRRGTVNGAGHQLYSGSTVNRLRGADYDYDFNVKGLERQHAAEEAQNRREQREADERYDEAVQNFKAEAIDRIVSEAPEPQPEQDFGGPPAPGGGGKKSKPKPKPHKPQQQQPKNKGKR